MEKRKIHAILSLMFAAAFAMWTAALKCVDVQAIGPNGSSVGLAAINAAVHELNPQRGDSPDGGPHYTH